jgi:cytochrome P450
MSGHLVSFDPPRHTAHRALLNGLFTPKRLKENEEFMWRLADRLIDEFIADGHCEFASAYGQPFPLLVIADLLGVPEADHSMFRELLAGNGPRRIRVGFSATRTAR